MQQNAGSTEKASHSLHALCSRCKLILVLILIVPLASFDINLNLDAAQGRERPPKYPCIGYNEGGGEDLAKYYEGRIGLLQRKIEKRYGALLERA